MVDLLLNLIIRTIIGAEKDKKTGEISVFIFDPAHIGPRLKHALKFGFVGDGSNLL